MSIGSNRYSNPPRVRTLDRKTYSQFFKRPPCGHGVMVKTAFDIPCNLWPVVASLQLIDNWFILHLNSVFLRKWMGFDIYNSMPFLRLYPETVINSWTVNYSGGRNNKYWIWGPKRATEQYHRKIVSKTIQRLVIHEVPRLSRKRYCPNFQIVYEFRCWMTGTQQQQCVWYRASCSPHILERNTQPTTRTP